MWIYYQFLYILFSFLIGYLIFEFQQFSSSNYLYRSGGFTGEKEIPLSDGTQPIRVIDFAKRKLLIARLVTYFVSKKKTITHVSLFFIHSFFLQYLLQKYTKLNCERKQNFFLHFYKIYVIKNIFENKIIIVHSKIENSSRNYIHWSKN